MDNASLNINAERGKYIAAVVLYGTIGMLIRYVHMPSEAVALCRGLIGALFIWIYCRITKHRFDTEAIGKNLRWLIASGVFLGLNWIFLFAAYVRTTVAIASLCNYLAPMLVIVVAPVLLREPIERRKIPCVIAALIGIVLISGVLRERAGDFGGILMGLAAAAAFMGVVICNRKMSGISPMDKAQIQLFISALTILPYVLLRFRPEDYVLDTATLLIVLVVGIVHTGFAYCLYFSGMKTLPVQTVAVLGYIEPVVSVLCSVFFLHEVLMPEGWVGAVLIIAAAVSSEIL